MLYEWCKPLDFYHMINCIIKRMCAWESRRCEVDNIDRKVGKGCIACGSFKFDGGTIKYSIIIKYQE